jgi:glyoxylate/hydroxypyruvate reductase A
MSLVIKVGPARAAWWKRTMRDLLPEFECRLWEDPGDPEDVEYAVVWRPPPGGLKRFPNLKCIVSIGAGVDHIFADPELPRGIPIIRTVGQDLRQRMREYVTLHVLRLHRRLPEFEAQQASGAWDQLITPPAPQRRIGIMGLGNMGRACAEALAYLGFDVAGWSRREKSLKGIAGFHGAAQLDAFLARSEILVSLLPLTPQTEGILNAGLFARLPEGACLVSVGRGEHLVEEDLIPALESGRLGYATLDVFREEPLPPAHPFWAHPRILVTPHVASLIDPLAGGHLIAENLRRFLRGEPVPDMVDLEKGY